LTAFGIEIRKDYFLALLERNKHIKADLIAKRLLKVGTGFTEKVIKVIGGKNGCMRRLVDQILEIAKYLAQFHRPIIWFADNG